MASEPMIRNIEAEESERRHSGFFASGITRYSDAIEDANEDQILRFSRFGMAAILVFELTHLCLGLYFAPNLTHLVAPILGADLGVTALMLGLTWSEVYRHRWRTMAFGLCTGLVLSATAISIISHDGIAIFISLLLLMFGSSAVVPWGPRCQMVFSGLCLSAMGANAAVVHFADGYAPFRWLAILTAVGFSQFTAVMGENYRRRLAARLSAMRESEQQIWQIFEANPDPVSIARFPDGQFLNVNSQFLKIGFTRDEVLHSTDRALGMWANPGECEEYYRQIKQYGYVRNLEATFVNRKGQARSCLVSGALMQFSHGPCVLAVTRDINRIKEAERVLVTARETAEQASRAKSDFLSSMSHEIRTPMNAILGMAELLNDSELSNEQHKYLSIMMNNGNALLDLINDILDFAKVESGRLNLETANFDVADLAERVAETLSIRAHQQGLELAVRVAPEVPTAIIGDPLRLRQVLINLIGNALKFTEHGEIVLTIDRAAGDAAPGALEFSVSDTGIGISPEEREKIFASYAQADSSTARKYGGTGLGLAIVKQLVELMGGRIWVDSEVGRGSTFHFTATFGVQAGASERSIDRVADLAGARVLVVDDTAVNRQALGEILTQQGAEVTATDHGEDALERLRQMNSRGTPFDLVLLDCRMAATDGVELARRVSEQAHGAGMVIPMLTSDDLNIKLPLLRKMGFMHHVIKPVRRAELLALIRTMIGQRAATAQPAMAAAIATTVASAPETTPEADAGTPAPLTLDRPLKILIADDSPDNRLLIEAFLKKSACQLDHAENGEIAVEKFVAGRYDVVLMDIQMPVMDGYTAARLIREWEKKNNCGHTPIIALTASVLDEAVHKSFDAGCDTHVSKPVRRPTLIAAIHSLTSHEAKRTKLDGAQRFDESYADPR